MKTSDILVQILKDCGVRHVFEVSGGMITHLLDSLFHEPALRIVSFHHEQSAGFAAEAAGRLTGIPGVALATSGPGATNLLTAVASSYFDSSPTVFITGQVNRNELKNDRPVRQLGFQECDIVSMARPVTKAAIQVQRAEEAPDRLKEAFHVASSGRPGPVLVDIPMDLQKANIEPVCSFRSKPEIAINQPGPSRIQELLKALQCAKRPLILAGGGIKSAHCVADLRSLVHKIHVPVVYSLMAIDALPYDDPLRVGMIGTYGNRWANIAVSRSDLLLILGSRLDIRQTGANVQAFSQGRILFHVDIDPGEINNRVPACEEVVADLNSFLSAVMQEVVSTDVQPRSDWLNEINALRSAWPDTEELRNVPGINPNRFMHMLSSVSKLAAVYVIDVGQHQMWAAQSLEPGADQYVMTTGGLGAMGFALPAGIGAAFTAKRPIIVIAGDGGFQTNLQELELIARHALPIKIIVVNNQSLGMVRQFQQECFESRYQSTVWGYGAPDFTKVAESYGISGRTITQEHEVSDALKWLWKDPAAPALLDVSVAQQANAYPKMRFGSTLADMEPPP